MITLAEILRDSSYKLTQFTLIEILNLEKRIIERNDIKGNRIPYVNCLVRNKEIKLTPEETIRQLYLQILISEYGYPATRIELEYAVSFGREKKEQILLFLTKIIRFPHTSLLNLKSPN